MAIQTNDTGNKIWEWMDNRPVDIKQCQDFEMKIPKKLLKTFRIPISICQDKDRCGTNIERSVVDGYYIGNCELGEIPFGMLLLEISSNIPQNEPFFTPVCIPAEKEPVQPNDVVHFDSLKVTKPITYVTSNKATIGKCPANIGTFVQSMCAKRDQCTDKSGGRGGSLVKKIDDRETIVGVSSYYENCPDGHFVSVGFFKDKLCSLAGICKTTIPLSDSSVGTTLGLIYMITAGFLFL
ncbi:hypothetical protein CAEBREN_13753 [Caenorhabditis brenneri]|uniref:Peptidase S1 domain-containing protein n=1 Tax=Caenorhabditis brenneri TaxID=135651 RepID=G0NK49_CAEBE|nr:hypothetical protein CAEBREN_13753 [Caenorhabditis brenneri]